MRKRHEDILKELTALPTAAGLEYRVIEWIERWAEGRKTITLARDTFGNITIKRRGARSTKPIYITAHMDHPAFAVTDVHPGGRCVQAEFRGGVHDDYFKGSPVYLHHGSNKPVRGEIISLDRKRTRELRQLVTVQFKRPARCSPGDLMTWALPKPRVVKGMLRAPACDDLAAVAAAICAYERMLAKPKGLGDVRLLFTRAEEVGFIGAIAACKAGTIPKGATLVCLENSKSMAESPIGAGPIIRVGDRTSIFDPTLTARLVAVAESLSKQNKRFKYQRKLMPGGTCESTAFRLYGYLSSCICLPLGNYHNMDEEAGTIAPESIAMADYHLSITLLQAVGRTLNQTHAEGDLVARLDHLFERERHLID